MDWSYKDYSKQFDEFEKNDFQDFCSRYQKVMCRKFRVTQAIGGRGDGACDGILYPSSVFLACYGPEKFTTKKVLDDKVSSKLIEDFNSMFLKKIKSNTLISKMVFMTKSEGQGLKTQEVLTKIRGIEYQNELIKNNKLAFTLEIPVEVDYVDKIDIFERLREIDNPRTFEYIFNNKLFIQTKEDKKMIRQHMNLFDESAFISEFLNMCILHFDNPEAPYPMKLDELEEFLKIIELKIKRDMRKFNVESEDKVPYIPLEYSITDGSISAVFDIPLALRQEFPPFFLTPYELKCIMQEIYNYISGDSNFRESDLFIDLFTFFFSKSKFGDKLSKKQVKLIREFKLKLEYHIFKAFSSTKDVDIEPQLGDYVRNESGYIILFEKDRS